jgi:hypothetical protein
MSRPKIIKATYGQKTDYQKKKHVWLFGYVSVSGKECVIEDLRGSAGAGEPKYEVMAPKGMKFAEHDLHSLMCVNTRAIEAQLVGVTLESCDMDCEWCHGESSIRGMIKEYGADAVANDDL